MNGFLGIDAGTQGLSATYTDENMRVLAIGEGAYTMIGGLPEGHYEQHTADWERALRTALGELKRNMNAMCPDWQVRAIGISAQMHGEVLADAEGRALDTARTWCDVRNEAEGEELTRAFGIKIPKRLTVARWLWTLRNRPKLARRVEHLSTPGGWLAFLLTGEWIVGIGDASGMFPIDGQTGTFDADLLRRFDARAAGARRPLADLLPRVRAAGEDGGTLQPSAAERFGLPAGIPVAPAEGDQPAALAGSLVAEPGMVAMSFGTSICASLVSDRAFQGMHPGIDHFCTVDGKPFHIAWLRNGTLFMNRIVHLFAVDSGDSAAAFARVMPHAVTVPPDCGGLLALPFMDEEPGLGVSRGGTALIAGLNEGNATPGHLAKTAILATMFNLKAHVDVLTDQGFARTGIILSGGLTRTPEWGQLLADVFQTPVVLLASASEGSAWGAALLAKYRWLAIRGEAGSWCAFLSRQPAGETLRFVPDPERSCVYRDGYERHRMLLRLQPELEKIFGPTPSRGSARPCAECAE